MNDFIISTSNYLSDDTTLLYRWQELIGAVVGVVGALLATLVGLYLTQSYRKYLEHRESLRMTEVSLALALSDIYDAQQHLRDFLQRLDEAVMQPLNQPQDPTQYVLSKTNFPHLVINLDSSLIKNKFNSYYVHNKVLILCKNVSHMNRMFVEMKSDYEKIFTSAQFLIAQHATPTNQQSEYRSHHESFIVFVNDVISQLEIAKKYFAQPKVFNLKLLKREWFSVWRYEGISFKPFVNKKHIQEYRNTLKSLDRIDSFLDEEVNALFQEVNNRNDGEIVRPLDFKGFYDLTIRLVSKVWRFITTGNGGKPE